MVECHGSVVNNGDFCCSVNGTTTTCCNTASNGLSLVAPVSSAQAVSATFVGGSIVPTSSSSGVIASSFGKFPTTCPNIRACFPPLAQISVLISHHLRKYQGLHDNSWQVLSHPHPFRQPLRNPMDPQVCLGPGKSTLELGL